MDGLLMLIMYNNLLLKTIREHLPEHDFDALCCALFCFNSKYHPYSADFDRCFMADDGIICIGSHFGY